MKPIWRGAGAQEMGGISFCIMVNRVGISPFIITKIGGTSHFMTLIL